MKDVPLSMAELAKIEFETLCKWHDDEFLDSGENFIKKELKREFFPVKIDNSYDVGHGHVLSVKIVIPSFCQANCPFCFNKQTADTQVHDFDKFFENLEDSLDDIFHTIYGRRISIDITGNEPTFDIDNFKRLMDVLKKYKDTNSWQIDKIVLTTNGYQLDQCIEYMVGIVDIVNISVHHYEYSTRVKDIFRTTKIPSNDELKYLNAKLHENGIKTTCIGVIYKPFEDNLDYVIYVIKFADFAISQGFENTRIRLDFTDATGEMEKIFKYEFKNEIVQEQAGLSTKILKRRDFDIKIYKGVKNLVDYVIGVEMVVDDDGKLYLDYNKRFPLKDREYWRDFNYNIYVLK